MDEDQVDEDEGENGEMNQCDEGEKMCKNVRKVSPKGKCELRQARQ